MQTSLDLKAAWLPGGEVPSNKFLPGFRVRKIHSVWNLSPEVPLQKGLEALASDLLQEMSPSNIHRLLRFVLGHEVFGLNDGTFVLIPLLYPSLYKLNAFHDTNLFDAQGEGTVQWSQTKLAPECALLWDLSVEDVLDNIRNQALECHAQIWVGVREGGGGLANYKPFQKIFPDLEKVWHDHLVAVLANVRLEGTTIHHPSCVPNVSHRVAAWINGKRRKARATTSGELEHIRDLLGDAQRDLGDLDLSLAAAWAQNTWPKPFKESPVSHWTYSFKGGWVSLGVPVNAAQVVWDDLFSQGLGGRALSCAWHEALQKKIQETCPTPFKYQLKNLQRLLDYKPKHETSQEYLAGIMVTIRP